MKSWLEKNDMEMYSTYSERKYGVAETFIRTLKNKTYKCMTLVSKNIDTEKLDDIVDKYNNTYHSTIKVKPLKAKSNTYFDSGKEINDKNPKFEIGDTVRILKYFSFERLYSKLVWRSFYDKIKVKNTLPWRYVMNDLNREEIVETFYKIEL